MDVLPDRKPPQAELPVEDAVIKQHTGTQDTDVAVPLQHSYHEGDTFILCQIISWKNCSVLCNYKYTVVAYT